MQLHVAEMIESPSSSSSLAAATTAESSGGDGSGKIGVGSRQPQHSKYGVRVLRGGSDLVVPTTEELMEYIRNDEAWQRIETLQEDALQMAQEKVAISDQTYALVDSTVKRLDRDLAKLETYVLVKSMCIRRQKHSHSPYYSLGCSRYSRGQGVSVVFVDVSNTIGLLSV